MGMKLHRRPRRRSVEVAGLSTVSWLAVLTLLSMPGPTQADQTYDECVRQACALNDYIGCGSNCSMRGPSSAPNRLPPVPQLFGAIAVETRTLSIGFAKGETSRAGAERQALAGCRQAGGSMKGCEIVVWGHNLCFALATSHEPVGRENVWGYATSDDGWVSRRDAMRFCRKAGGTRCAVAVKFCTG